MPNNGFWLLTMSVEVEVEEAEGRTCEDGVADEDWIV